MSHAGAGAVADVVPTGSQAAAADAVAFTAQRKSGKRRRLPEGETFAVCMSKRRCYV